MHYGVSTETTNAKDQCVLRTAYCLLVFGLWFPLSASCLVLTVTFVVRQLSDHILAMFHLFEFLQICLNHHPD